MRSNGRNAPGPGRCGPLYLPVLFESMAPMPNERLRKAIVTGASLLQGGYMLFDGTHRLITGNYFGGRLGPWAALVAMIGIRPGSMAPAFIVAGVLWLAAGAGSVFEWRWSRALLIALSVISLAYLVFGTILSLLVLVILFTERRRAA
jgi:hypothetical protein